MPGEPLGMPDAVLDVELVLPAATAAVALVDAVVAGPVVDVLVGAAATVLVVGAVVDVPADADVAGAAVDVLATGAVDAVIGAVVDVPAGAAVDVVLNGVVVEDVTVVGVVAGTELVVLVVPLVLDKKSLAIVAVQVTVLAPVVPEALHWLMVVGRPVFCDAGAVTVQVSVPPAPPELLHWVTLWPPGPAVPARLFPGGVATQVLVLTPPGCWHCVTVEAIVAPTG